MEKLWENINLTKKYSSKFFSIAETFSNLKNLLPYKRNYQKLNKEQLNCLINDAYKYEWEILDLTNCGIKEFPEELCKLKKLKVLFLGNRTSNDSNSTNEIPDSNSINEIPDSIESLVSLESLSIYGLNKIKISKKIKNLRSLTYMDCFRCNLDNFNYIPSLKGVGIDCNDSKLLEDICKIKGLEYLYLTESKLKVLPDCLCYLSNLKVLYIAKSSIELISNNLLNLKSLKHFNIFDTPLSEKVPPEIKSQTALELIYYICKQQIERGNLTFNESKMIVVGQGNVGKSCLVERITNNNYFEKESTEGIDIKQWTYTYNKKSYRLNIWDFGGQEIYHSTHQFFLTKRSLYVFVWDARAEEEYGRIDYWLKTIESFAEDSPIIIAINKCDINTNRINRIDFKTYQGKYPQIKTIIDISCKDNLHITQLSSLIKKTAANLPIMKVQWLEKWLSVRKHLEKLSESINYINYEEYKNICKAYCLEDSETVSLCKYLHDLGAILHYYDDMLLKNILILSPEWATSAVYKILDSQESVLKNRNGLIDVNDLPNVWNNKDIYPEEKYIFLLKIMEKFELCFEINKEMYLVTELLENTALDIPSGWSFTPSKTIRFIYKYEFMPAGVMTRFIVKINKYLYEKNGIKQCWKKGAYLKFKNAYASVIMTDNLSEKKIEINVSKISNTNDDREFMTIIRQNLDDINQTFKKLIVNGFVPCNCSGDCTFLFDYDTLLRAICKGVSDIECHGSFTKVNVLKLLDGIEIKEDKKEMSNTMYNLKIENNPTISSQINTHVINDNNNTSNNSQNINIKSAIFEIQGNLNELDSELNNDNIDLKKEIDKISSSISELENIESKEEVVKSGKLNKIRRFLEGFSDEDGEYRKLISGSKKISKIIFDIGKKYNIIANFLGITDIPFFK